MGKKQRIGLVMKKENKTKGEKVREVDCAPENSVFSNIKYLTLIKNLNNAWKCLKTYLKVMLMKKHICDSPSFNRLKNWS